MQDHRVLLAVARDDEAQPAEFRMPFADLRDLGRMHEHALHLGGLVGAAEPALDAHIRASAGGGTFQHGGQVAGSEPQQRIVGIEPRDDDLADLAFLHRLVSAGLHDLDADVLVGDEAVHRLAFVGDHTEFGGAIGLQHGDAAFGEFLAKACRQRRAGDQRLGDRTRIDLHVRRAVEQNLEKIRRAAISVGLVRADRVDLLFDIARAGRDDGATERVGATLHHVAAGREMIRKCVEDDVALAESGGIHGAGAAPPVPRMAFGFEDRTGRDEQPPQLRRASRCEAAEGRLVGLTFCEF